MLRVAERSWEGEGIASPVACKACPLAVGILVGGGQVTGRLRGELGPRSGDATSPSDRRSQCASCGRVLRCGHVAF
jgi:hypothetical protein